MITIKSEEEIALMRESGRVTGKILEDLRSFIRPGITTMDINDFVEDAIRSQGMEPTFLGYNGYPASVCASVNEEIVHGIPSSERVLDEGDIVSVDIGATNKGFVTDCARTYAVGEVSEELRRLIDAAEEGFFAGLEHCRPGRRISDIGHAVQQSVEAKGYGVVREFVGHGVGADMHEDPKIPNYGRAGHGPRIAKGMAFAIEPMITLGTYKVKMMPNGWTVSTKDGKAAAHYENTVIVKESEPEVLTGASEVKAANVEKGCY